MGSCSISEPKMTLYLPELSNSLSEAGKTAFKLYIYIIWGMELVIQKALNSKCGKKREIISSLLCKLAHVFGWILTSVKLCESSQGWNPWKFVHWGNTTLQMYKVVTNHPSANQDQSAMAETHQTTVRITWSQSLSKKPQFFRGKIRQRRRTGKIGNVAKAKIALSALSSTSETPWCTYVVYHAKGVSFPSLNILFSLQQPGESFTKPLRNT